MKSNFGLIWKCFPFSPGAVITGFGRSMGFDESAFPVFYNYLTEKSLMKRVGQSEDIANLASFLASDDAKNITGSIYVSDSGYLLHTPEINLEDLTKLAPK